MWIELITELSPEAQFAPPAGPGALDEVERGLGQPLPAQLRELLAESDGALGELSLDVVWSAGRILADNQAFRISEDFAELYAPFDGLLFFGDNGGGDQFAFLTDAHGEGVFVWEHETDTRRKVADDLADYLRRILTADGDDWYVTHDESEH
ncbi:SMI1/KNR4 family protein [Dactylosporangium sp. NBC_01737]|uniref:SMI1/KNR4 family protein n=1 Tax=Dactylosporangium sp. NBC_01737 TaxID=2975959 RepID=UPI002E0FFF1E|nr:SMI1/KNR4 family protein [Dactylosporangium sp. NBC_01737]